MPMPRYDYDRLYGGARHGSSRQYPRIIVPPASDDILNEPDGPDERQPRLPPDVEPVPFADLARGRGPHRPNFMLIWWLIKWGGLGLLILGLVAGVIALTLLAVWLIST